MENKTIEELHAEHHNKTLTLENIQVDCTCLTKEQIEEMKMVVVENGYELGDSTYAFSINYIYCYFRLNKHLAQYGVFNENKSRTTITYDKFMELFDKPKTQIKLGKRGKGLIIDSTKQGIKESSGKTRYELDFDFIEAMAKRIESETKYPPYNWKKPIDVQELTNAILRHAIELKKGNFDDNGELGHLVAIACNAMFTYYQLKNNK